ncbi:MAG: hypothetical protein ACKV19_11545 [Verrucomicrobiales bacterium]
MKLSQHHRRAGAVLGLLLLTTGALADSTINATQKFAYAANAGWINFRHDQPASPAGVVFGEYVVSGYAFAANFGWINFGDGTPANGVRYQDNSASDFGVNHDGAGNLSGYAYGANIGWINFGWDPGHASRPRVNLATGNFSGYAYSANIGWIRLDTIDSGLRTDTMRCTDTDSDGMADEWEMAYFGDLTTATFTSNADGDSASDKLEYLSSTDPGDSADFLDIVSSRWNGTFTAATIVFTTNATRLYRIETSDSLGIAPGAWVDSGLGVITPDAGPTTTRLVTWPGATQKFLRAVSVKPLQP